MAAPNLNAFLAALLKQVQKVEDVFAQIITTRFLGFATGAQLDALGRLVGRARLGLTDDPYRQAIRLQVYINGSDGRCEDLLYVAQQITGFPAQYLDVTAGNCRILIPDWTPDDGSLLAFLQSICPAGVRLLDVTTTGATLPFRMKDRMKTRLLHT